MINNCNPYATTASAKIVVHHGKIISANMEFEELTGYAPKELEYMEVACFFEHQLRSNYSFDTDETSPAEDSVIFTKSLELREVDIKRVSGENENGYVLLLQEKPYSRLENKFMCMNKILQENMIGVGIYKIPEYMLVKANSKYLSFLGNPFGNPSAAYGKSLSQIIPDWEASKVKKSFDEIIRNDKSVCYTERPALLLNDYSRYWDNTLTPVSENGHVKYIISQISEVTDRVMSREHTNSYAKQLEAVIGSMSGNLSIFDRDGNYVYLNSTAQTVFPAANVHKILDDYSDISFYDSVGNIVPREDLPLFRVLRGEHIKGYKLICRTHDVERFLDISGMPIINNDGEFYLGVLCSQDITERVSKEQQIKLQQELLLSAEVEKRELLENTLKTKDEFLYIISHEFKTPLAVINSAIQTMELVYKDQITPKLEKYLNIIKQNSNRQLRLVNNLLDITRINSGFSKVKRNNIDIIALTAAIIDSVELYAMQKHIKLTFSCRFGKMNLCLDEEKYERILLNLLSNAIKFTPNGKSINVSITCVQRSKKDMVCLAVKDEGIGIPTDKQTYIFERFGQADTTLTRQAEGTGIGLYLVKQLVSAMDGTVELYSKVGRGSIFKVLLPTDRAVCNNENGSKLDNQAAESNSRLIQAAAIEFSDIYF